MRRLGEPLETAAVLHRQAHLLGCHQLPFVIGSGFDSEARSGFPKAPDPSLGAVGSPALNQTGARRGLGHGRTCGPDRPTTLGSVLRPFSGQVAFQPGLFNHSPSPAPRPGRSPTGSRPEPPPGASSDHQPQPPPGGARGCTRPTARDLVTGLRSLSRPRPTLHPDRAAPARLKGAGASRSHPTHPETGADHPPAPASGVAGRPGGPARASRPLIGGECRGPGALASRW